MAIFNLFNVAVKGIAACVPNTEVSNMDYSLISEKERLLLVKTTGIKYRRKVNESQCASDLCLEAAEQLLTQLNWDKNEVQALIFVTQTPDYITPATAIIMQHKLGLSQNCLAFDINLGCSAYVYGLSVVGSLLSNSGLKKALLLVGDACSTIVSEEDKSVAPLFSDAGSATALAFEPDAPPMHFNLQSDGSGYNAIIVPHGGARNRVTPQSLTYEELEKGIKRNKYQMILNGLDIFNFTLKEVAPNVEALLHANNKTINDFDYFVFHQANLLLNERIRQKLKLPPEKVPYSITKFGNTSCTTLPLTMVSELSNKLQNNQLSLVLSGFGVGLSWGSVLIQTNKIVCPPLIISKQ